MRKAHDSNKSNPQLLDILIDGFHSWFKNQPIDCNRYLTQYRQVVKEQTEIGWQHMFNGHFTSQWRILQDWYIQQLKIHTITHTGARWSLRTITTLWNDFFVLWQSRNETIHGHDLASQQLARRRKLGIEMEFLHAQQDQVLACDADTFIGNTPTDLTQYLDVTTATQVQNWLYTWKPFIQSSIDCAKDLSIQGV
jgi:hypothetical protein